jgi:transposase-like protein
MPSCKRCAAESVVKNGIIRGKQRYRCHKCGCNFTEGDARVKALLPARKALAAVLYSSAAKSSYRTLSRVFGVSHTMVHNWVAQLSVPAAAGAQGGGERADMEGGREQIAPAAE